MLCQAFKNEKYSFLLSAFFENKKGYLLKKNKRIKAVYI
jgi:hypothetical protein